MLGLGITGVALTYALRRPEANSAATAKDVGQDGGIAPGRLGEPLPCANHAPEQVGRPVAGSFGTLHALLVIAGPGAARRGPSGFHRLSGLLGDHRPTQPLASELRERRIIHNLLVAGARDDLAGGFLGERDFRGTIPATGATLDRADHVVPCHASVTSIQVAHSPEGVRAQKQRDVVGLVAERALSRRQGLQLDIAIPSLFQAVRGKELLREPIQDVPGDPLDDLVAAAEAVGPVGRAGR